MNNPFVRKLEGFVPLPPERRREIDDLTARVQHLKPRENIAREGDGSEFVNVVLSGWACHYRLLPDGRRQIVSLFLPGDICDPHALLLDHVSHAFGTLTPVTLARMSASAVRTIAMGQSELAEALWWQMLTAARIQCEWTISLGRRTAIERLAHLFCEVSERLVAVGVSNGSDCEWPLTQTDLADVSGLSTVHVNRSLQELRATGLIELRSRRLTIHDHRGLTDLAMFDPGYLRRRSDRDLDGRAA